MSDITFLQYTPHKEKKRPSHGGAGACVNCRKAHAACNSYRPCDRCVRMRCECQPYDKKQKTETKKVKVASNCLDVDAVSQLLFSDSAGRPATPSQDSFALPSPLSSYIHDPNESANFVAYNDTPSTPSPPAVSPSSFPSILPQSFSTSSTLSPPDMFPRQTFPTTPEPASTAFNLNTLTAQPFTSTLPTDPTSLLLTQSTCTRAITVNTIETHSQSPTNTLPTEIRPTPSTLINTSTSAVVNSSDSKLDELMAQNARMEMCLREVMRKVDFLQAQIPVVTRPGVAAISLPATATWKLPTCELLECNQAFLDLLGYNAEDNAKITFFQLGACKDAIAAVKKKIDHSIETNTPIKEPTHSDTLRIPMFKKNRECILLTVTAIVCLDSPQPTLTTVLHKIPPPESS